MVARSLAAFSCIKEIMSSVLKGDDIKDSNGLWLKTYTDGVDRYASKSCRVWNSMRNRCKVGGKLQARQSTYIGCSMSDNFKSFQFFAEWYNNQIGCHLDGYQLDKDILVSGNKLYSEDTCVIVPQKLNKFLTATNASRGEWPQGVSFHKRDGKFRTQINIDGKVTEVGSYSTPEIAAVVYKKAKEAEAYRWYERLKAGEFVIDERVIEAMRVWTLPQNS